MSSAPALPATNAARPARLPLRPRLLAALVAAGLLTPLVLASSLSADARGVSTHTQLGLPACGWLVVTGHPCPTCGMTTAFTHAAHGRMGAAFVTQPMGAILAVLFAAGVVVALHVALTGSRAGSLCAKLLAPRVLIAGAIIWAASWAYKIATYSA